MPWSATLDPGAQQMAQDSVSKILPDDPRGFTAALVFLRICCSVNRIYIYESGSPGARAENLCRLRGDQEVGWSNLLHDGRTGETANHESDQMRLQVMSGDFLMRPRQCEFGKTNDEACDSDLCADVQELGDDSFN